MLYNFDQVQGIRYHGGSKVILLYSELRHFFDLLYKSYFFFDDIDLGFNFFDGLLCLFWI
jgi:hypothetical protein